MTVGKFKPNKRQREILTTLKLLGGTAYCHDIARLTNRKTNGITRSLCTLADKGFVVFIDGSKGESEWRLA